MAKLIRRKIQEGRDFKRRPINEEEIQAEWDVLIYSIYSTDYLKKIHPFIKPHFFEVPWVRKTWNMIDEHFKQYEIALGHEDFQKKYFKDIKPKLQTVEADLMEAFLTNLSDESKEFEDFREERIPYLVGDALMWAQKRRAKIAIEAYNNLIEKGKQQEAFSILSEFHSLATPDLIGFEEGFTGTELSNMEIKEPSWIIKGILPMGLTLLAGKPKTGKSFFLFDIAVSVAQGGKNIFDSSIRARKREVLYLALEDSKKRLKDRWIKMVGEGVILDDIHIFPGRSWPKLNNGGLQKLETWMEEHTKTKLVIIDILEKVRSRPKAQGYFYADDYQTISQLQEFASKHKIGFVVVHHSNKSKTEDVYDEISSTTGLTGAADTIAVLSKVDTGRADRVYSVTGRDIEDKRLAFKFDNFRWKLLGDADEYRMSKERKGIVDLIRESGRPMKRDEIVRERSPKKGTDVLLKKLVDSGEIEKYGYGQYVIKGYVEKEISKGLIKSRRFIHKEN